MNKKNDDDGDDDGMSMDGMRAVVSIRIKCFSSERKLKTQDASIRFIFAFKSVGCRAKKAKKTKKENVNHTNEMEL